MKEIDIQVQEAQRVLEALDPTTWIQRGLLQDTLPKTKDEERILKALREKERVTYKGVSIECQLIFQRNVAGKKRLEGSIQIHEKQGPTSQITLSSRAVIDNGRQIKCFPGTVKLKEFIITKLLLYEMLKGLISEKEDKK